MVEAAGVCTPSEDSDDLEGDPTFSPKKLRETYIAKDGKHRDLCHRWLCEVFDYLSLPANKCKKDVNRIQHTSQVELIMEALEPQGTDITCLTWKNGDVVWKDWVKKHLDAKDMAAGTICSYLTSLQLFLKYILAKKY